MMSVPRVSKTTRLSRLWKAQKSCPRRLLTSNQIQSASILPFGWMVLLSDRFLGANWMLAGVEIHHHGAAAAEPRAV